MSRKQDEKSKKILIGMGVSGVVAVGAYVWYYCDLHQQSCAMQDMLCVPEGNRLLFTLFRLALTAVIILGLALVEHKREISKGIKISVARKAVGYMMLAIIVFLVVSYLTGFVAKL